MVKVHREDQFVLLYECTYCAFLFNKKTCGDSVVLIVTCEYIVNKSANGLGGNKSGNSVQGEIPQFVYSQFEFCELFNKDIQLLSCVSIVVTTT
jgi:hypothetical protein